MTEPTTEEKLRILLKCLPEAPFRAQFEQEVAALIADRDNLRAQIKTMRDNTLEDAAKACIDFGKSISEVGCVNIGEYFAEEIIAMKGKK